jgi:membrane protein
VAGRALLAIARAYDREAPAPDAGDVASELGCSADDVSEVVLALKAAGLVVPLGDGGLVPARPLERISLLDVRRAISGKEPPIGAGAGLVGALVRGVEDEAAERLAAVSLRELCDRERGSAAGASPDAPGPGSQADAEPARSA